MCRVWFSGYTGGDRISGVVNRVVVVVYDRNIDENDVRRNE